MTNGSGAPAYGSLWQDLIGVPFTQGYADAGGIRTRYLQAGDKGKPGLIFLHGTGGHAEAYSRNLGAHAEHFNTYAIDMLGHGFTAKPDFDYDIPQYHKHLVAFMDAVGLETASFSGESLGGWVAASFAVAHPERVDKLVLNTASAEKINPQALDAIRTSTKGAVEDPNWEKVRARLEWLMYDKTMVHDDLVATRRAVYLQPDMKAGIDHLLCLHTMEARQRFAVKKEEWAQLDKPTLVLWTTHDPTAKVEVGEELHALIPGSRFVVMQNCGHWPQFEDAETFNRVHIDFLLGK